MTATYEIWPFIWVKQPKNTSTIIKKTTRYKPMSCRKMGARLNFIEHILHLFTYCISARILFFVSGIILSSKQWIISYKEVFFSFKSTYHAEKWKWGLPLKDVLHLSTHYIWGNICLVFKAGCSLEAVCSFKSNRVRPRIAAMCINHCSFWQQYWMLNLILQCFGRLHFYRNERCMFWETSIFRRDTTSWKK